MSKVYKVPVEFVFKGEFEIKAANKEEAYQIANDGCGLNMGEIHTSYDEEIKNWNYSMTPDKKIGKITRA